MNPDKPLHSGPRPSDPIAVCLSLTRAISRAQALDDIYAAALDALEQGLGVTRASILLFDPDGVMRFKAFRGLSDRYRAAVEGHTPWAPDDGDVPPIVVEDVTRAPSLQAYLPVVQAEGIAAMAFVPLLSLGRVIGKFMLYYGAPRKVGDEELQLAGVVAAQVAFAVERTRAAAVALRSEARLRFALDAASMGTWDWDLRSNIVEWSDNLEALHGLRPGAFAGSFESYAAEIFPEDRDRVLAAGHRAIDSGAPYDVEYRIVSPDGTIRWVEGKGRVEREGDAAVRMSGVCMIVTRRKEAELARLSALEESGRLKDEFLATLSHELRTPLNAILGWVQMLQGAQPPERVAQAVSVIGRNAALQAKLIEDILDVSRIITGKLATEQLPVDVRALVDAAVAAVLPSASVRKIRVRAEIAPGMPIVLGDVRRLQQVLGNVLANAVKFTPEGGDVCVRCRADETVVIDVVDTGIGIEPEFLPFLFQRFRQADSRSTRRHGGLGLGLALARHLLEQHEGSIEAFSDGRGLGTTIRMRLPRTTGGAVVADDMKAASAIDSRLPRLAGRRVLVVDDQADSREVMALLLAGHGADVVQADSAARAFAILAEMPVQVLIADIAMPEIDGYELISRVRQKYGSLPAIAVSAYAHPEDRTRAFAAGYQAYCAKPWQAPELLRALCDVLG